MTDDILYENLNRKYLGILNGFDLSIIDKNVVEMLLSKNVIELHDKGSAEGYSYCQNERKFVPAKYKIENSKLFEIPLNFEDKTYYLTSSFHKEIYNIISCKIVWEVDYYYDYNIIEKRLNSYLDDDKKIKYLKKCYKNLYNKDYSDLEMIYSGKWENGFNNWEDYVKMFIEDSPEFIKLYLNFKVRNIHSWNSEIFEDNTPDKFSVENLDTIFFLNEILAENKSTIEEDIFEILDETEFMYSCHEQLKLIQNKIEELKNKPNLEDKESKNLEDLFVDPTKYKYIIKKLQKENLIDINLAIIANGEMGFKPTRLKACIGYLLNEKGYLKPLKSGKPAYDKTVCNALNNTFKDKFILSEQNYSKAIKTFQNQYSKDVHLDKLHFIK